VTFVLEGKLGPRDCKTCRHPKTSKKVHTHIQPSLFAASASRDFTNWTENIWGKNASIMNITDLFLFIIP
jgi:hypothetical protein